MKNKLLITSALVGMVASGSAFAETKITGGMTLGYKAYSGNTALASQDGFGRETQINVANTGTLSNGLGYAAGFSIEYDGQSTANTAETSVSNENVYFDIISGNTTVSFGLDHMPNTSQSATPRVAEHADTTFSASSMNSYDYHAGANIKESFAVGVIQKAPMGTFAVSYVPSIGDQGGSDDASGVATGADNSAFNIVYAGNAGINGLNVKAAYQKENNDPSEQDGKVKQFGIGYNFGTLAAGVTYNAIDEAQIGTNTKSYEFGATAALSKDVSAGILYIKTDGNDSGVAWAEEEVMTILQLGYNMGPATVSISAGTLENANGSRTVNDTDVAHVRLSTAF